MAIDLNSATLYLAFELLYLVIKESYIIIASDSLLDLKSIFSYPNGSYNKETLELMKKYRCKFSYTTVQETITKNTNYLEIPRFDGPQSLPL